MKKKYVKNLLLFFTFLIVFATVFAQNNFQKSFSLTWEYNQKIKTTPQHSFIIPICDKSAIDYQKKLPLFSSSWEINRNTTLDSYTIENVVLQTLTASQYGDLDLNNIPNEIKIDLAVLTTGIQNNLYLEIIPLIKKGNQVQQILSFDLSYTLKPLNLPQKHTRAMAAENSVLSSGKWYKIAVDTTGVYKIDRSFLTNLGISVSTVDPQKIQIYGNGGALLPYRIGDSRYDDLQENAIYVSGEADGKLDSQDYVLFYAKGPESWKHSNTINSLRHVKNIYTDKAYYFIHIGFENGKRIQNATSLTGTPTVTYTNFDDFWVYEKDQTNLFSSGQQWFGESFQVRNQQTFTHTFNNLDTSFPLTIKTRMVAVSNSITQVDVLANSQNLSSFQLSATSGHTLATSRESTGSLNTTNENIQIQINFNNNGNASAKAYLDYIELIGKKKLIAENKQFSFRNFDVINQTGLVAFSIQNPNNIFQIWNVTDPINPQNILNQAIDNSFQFNTNGSVLSEYILLNNQNYYTPTRPTDYVVENQNLHALTDVDYLIVTQKEFLGKAEELAQFHQSHSNLQIKAVPLYQIYNEFASGSPDITAIRDFVRTVSLNSNGKLKYLLLYGDTSFDFKGISGQTGIVPVFQSYQSFDMTQSFATDDFYGIISDETEGDLDQTIFQTLDIAVGRLPFNTLTEADQINQKIINYYSQNSVGDWKTNVLLIADDADTSGEDVLQTSQELLANEIHTNKPLVNLKKIWIDAYQQEVSAGGSRYPDVNTEINNAIESGVLYANYFGHGGESGLAAEKIIENPQVESWVNFNRLNLFSVISCEFARFDNPNRPNTAGELLIRNPNGGAMSEIATAREIFINYGDTFNHELNARILEFDNQSFSIAENLRLVKNNTTNKQRYFIFFLGDPAVKLALPRPNILLTHLNGTPITQSIDTLKALSKITLDGIVTAQDNQPDTDFNGEVYLTVFDKPQTKQTLSNDGIAPIMTFQTQDSKIFRGKSNVKNGQFHFEFVVPKDIRIAEGNGKLSFYASDQISEKGGYTTDVIIGGINYNAPEDQIGPQIKLYMNDTSFIDGGNTNQSPLFLAFLEDENGINTSFSSVDHDITAILDNDEQNPIILNEYYSTELNDFTKGNLEYRLRNLTVGNHTITLKAYDTYNNPSQATLHFVVVDDAKLILEHVLNYPNPFVNYTEFWFQHNKPNEPLDVTVQIFTVSGKLVKTLRQTVQNSGSLSRDIIWNGLDDFGQKIGKGVYVYKINVVTQNGLKTEKFEKLVVLQ